MLLFPNGGWHIHAIFLLNFLNTSLSAFPNHQPTLALKLPLKFELQIQIFYVFPQL